MTMSKMDKESMRVMQPVPAETFLIILTFCSHLFLSEGTDVNKLFTDVAHEHFVNCLEENFAIDIPAGGNPNNWVLRQLAILQKIW